MYFTNIQGRQQAFSNQMANRSCIIVLRAPIDNRELFASEGATLSGINQ